VLLTSALAVEPGFRGGNICYRYLCHNVCPVSASDVLCCIRPFYTLSFQFSFRCLLLCVLYVFPSPLYLVIHYFSSLCCKNVSILLLLTTASRPALGLTQPPIHWVPGALSLGVKRPGREADHSPPSSAGVKNACSHTSTFPILFHGGVLS
jgi:hypothetical protein